MTRVSIVLATGLLLLASLAVVCACANATQVEAGIANPLEEAAAAAQQPAEAIPASPEPPLADVGPQEVDTEIQPEKETVQPQEGAKVTQPAEVDPEPPQPEEAAETTSQDSAAIMDLTGWWKSDFSMYMIWRFEPNGTFLMYNRNPDLWHICMGVLSSGHIGVDGETLILSESSEHLAQFGTNLAGWACSLNQVGRYRLELPSPGVFDLTVLEDACVGRDTWYDTDVFHAVEGLAELLGTWRSDADENRILHFREDLTYSRRAADETSDERDMVGGINIEEGLLKVNDVSPPCGITDVGLYRMVFGDDGRLNFEAVQDDCEERRLALTSWGPLRREEPANELTGWWSAEGDAYQLQINRGGTYAIYDVGNLSAGPLHWGTLTQREGQVRLIDQLGVADCRDKEGSYEYSLVQETLVLEPISEPCAQRSSLFESHPHWHRADPIVSD